MNLYHLEVFSPRLQPHQANHMRKRYLGAILTALVTNTYADNRTFSKNFQDCTKLAITIDSQSRCVTDEVGKQKQRLNSAYNQLTGKLSKEQLDHLEKVQRSWLIWRDNNYNFLSEKVPGEFSTTRVTSLNFLLNAIYDRAEELEMISDEIGK
ncbi:lysozyme inhibitor LprI family protein [Ralstonia sp. A12]|uniref:lysozyme inhibitor LprI family protein n=1 Tax=Ralstonia sp. A12 TaxID=1217052 RepID=UPI0012EDD2CF|nr:lysozyme inhibitor LprI family protein [Ralstonia sp. A12]